MFQYHDFSHFSDGKCDKPLSPICHITMATEVSIIQSCDDVNAKNSGFHS